MRFLLINQFFAPDPAPTGQLLADVARALVAAGHSVTVVCGASSYGTCDAGGDHRLEQVEIRRVGRMSFGRSHGSRIASYASFVLALARHVVMGSRADVVLTLTTPPLVSLAGTFAKHVRGCRHVIWEMDMYPDVAVALGVFTAGGILDRTIGALADWSRREADEVIALGPCMRDRLALRGLSSAKITVAQNWVDGSLILPRPFPRLSPMVLLYSGNLGHAHDATTISEAMSSLTDSDRFRFIFAGGGAGRAELEAACRSRGAVNAWFLPYQDQEALVDHLGVCHIGLVTQKVSTCGAVVPSKTYGLMAAGRPFIFIGPRDATPALLIEEFQCGWHIEPGDSTGLVRLLEVLAMSPSAIQSAGIRGRTALLRFSDLPVGASRIVDVLTARKESENLLALAGAPSSVPDSRQPD